MAKHYKDMYPKPYLRPHDLKGATRVLTIKGTGIQKIYDAGAKKKVDTWVIYFEQTPKYLVGREVILDMISQATGETDPDNWAGHPIELFVRWEEHGGKKWELVRVQEATSQPPQQPSQAPKSKAISQAADHPQSSAPQPAVNNGVKADTPKDAYYAHAFGTLRMDKETTSDILIQCKNDYELALKELKKHHTPPVEA